MTTCTKHPTSKQGQNGKCKACNVEAVSACRRRRKALLVEYAGGKCLACGYDTYAGALEFHHVDPTTKSFTLAERGNTKHIQTLIDEVHKCVLTCANCHREIEAGVRPIPTTIPSYRPEVFGDSVFSPKKGLQGPRAPRNRCACGALISRKSISCVNCHSKNI